MLSHSSEEERRINRLEHAKFLLYQIQQELAGTNHNKDCVIQCQDGDLSTSLANLASISLLVRNIGQEDETPVIIVPSLQLGELLLFLKYLFSNKVEEMFNKEDVGVIENVCHILEIDIGWKPRSEDPDLAIIGVHRTEVEPQTEPSPPEIKDDKTFREKRIKEQEKLRTKIRCKFCDEMVPFTVLSKHVKQKHPEKDLCCLVCEYRGESKTELETHVQTHAGDLHYLSCERCGHVVLSQYQLQRHRKTHNLKNLQSEKCPHCEKMFQVKDKLNKHVLLHQTGVLDKRFGCDECEKEFSKPYDLARHKKSHSGVKTHFCDICGDRFVDGTRLKQHKWIHSDHKGRGDYPVP